MEQDNQSKMSVGGSSSRSLDDRKE